MGPEVFELEEKLADYVSRKHCISCSSGTDALLIPLMAYGVGPGDAVITTPFTYIATGEVIQMLGATPIFCDIYKDTYNIDPSGLEESYNFAISKGLNPKVIMPVDLFGLPARFRLIMEFAKKKKLFVIEDAAQGFGGTCHKKYAGSFGHVSSTSFFPAKPLGCYGDGGAIFTDDDELADKMKSIRVHGSGIDKYDNVRIGLNGRLDTIQAAIILEKLDIFNKELHMRNRVADYYSSTIENRFSLPFTPNDYSSSWAQYSVITESNEQRNSIIEHLKTKHVPSMIYYRIPLHLQKVFKNLNYKSGDFPVSEEISSKIFSLPMHPYLFKNEQDIIIEAINSYEK